jgi:hypothetical protein
MRVAKSVAPPNLCLGHHTSSSALLTLIESSEDSTARERKRGNRPWLPSALALGDMLQMAVDTVASSFVTHAPGAELTPIVYPAGWAERRTVPPGVEPQR